MASLKELQRNEATWGNENSANIPIASCTKTKAPTAPVPTSLSASSPAASSSPSASSSPASPTSPTSPAASSTETTSSDITHKLLLSTACERLVRVRIINLKDETQNNRIGTCGSLQYNKQSKDRRYIVTLDGDVTKSTLRKNQFKADNLEVISNTKETCALCSYLLPPSMSLEGKDAYQNMYYRRLINCCGKALCTRCDPSAAAVLAKSSSARPSSKCILCGKKTKSSSKSSSKSKTKLTTQMMIQCGSKEEFKLLKKFAKKHQAWAHVILGYRYLIGGTPDIVQQSDEQSMYHFEIAASNEHAEGYFNLGYGYFDGRFGGCCNDGKRVVDYGRAFSYFKLAVEQDHNKAMYYLGQMYEQGLVPNEPISLEKAREMYQRANGEEIRKECYFSIDKTIKIEEDEDEKSDEEEEVEEIKEKQHKNRR